MTRAARLLFFVTEDWYFHSHRFPLARAALAAGFEVAVVTRVQRHGERIREAGIDLVPLELARAGHNPLTELRTLRHLVRIYRERKPDIVHHVALKPVLYGTIAARIAGVPSVINALAGLGYLFSSTDVTARIVRPLVQLSFRAMLKPHHAIVQNPDDLKWAFERRLLDPGRTKMIRGSGVDLEAYPSTPIPDGTPLVVLPARFLWDKGLAEFVAAARIIKKRGVMARFALVGEPDPANPAAVPQATLENWRREGIVELWGWRDDMAEVFRECHIACLPSYREGLPKALLEAAACGRPLVSCDVPGCREIVRHGVNGLLVPPRDAPALADALAQLIADPQQRAVFGTAARTLVAAEFSVDHVIEQTLALYRELAPV